MLDVAVPGVIVADPVSCANSVVVKAKLREIMARASAII